MKSISQKIILLILILFSTYNLFAQSASENLPAENSHEPVQPQQEETVHTLPTVSVVGTYDAESKTPAVPNQTPYGTQFNTVTEEQIREQGSIDFLDTLKNVPGVVTSKKNLLGTNTGTSLYIRGRGYTHPSLETTTYFDSIPRYGLIYGQSMADGLPVNAVSNIEVYKYPQPSRFGTGYALVNVVPKYMNKQGMEFLAGFAGGSFGTFSENASFGLRHKWFDIYAAQSWNTTKGHVVHSGASQQSYYLNMGFWLNAYFDLRVLGNYVDAETEQAPREGQLKSDILGTYETNAAFATLTLNNEFDKASGFLKLYYNNTDFKWLDEDPKIPGDWSRQALTAIGGKASETFKFWKGNETITGIDLDYIDAINEDHNTTKITIISDFPNMLQFSPYAAISQYFGEEKKFHIIPSAGMRYFLHNVWKNELSPQAGLVLGYGELNLNLNYSLGVIYPAPANVQSLLNKSSFDVSDLDGVESETVNHYEAGVNFAVPGFFAVNLSAYHDDGRNRIIASGSSVPGNVSSASYFKITGLEAGGNVTIETDSSLLERLNLFAGGAWIIDLRAKGDKGKEVTRMPYTPLFSLSAGFKWTLYEHFHLSGDFQFLHDMYGGNLNRTDSFPELTPNQKLNDIKVVNLRFAYTFNYKKLRIEGAEIFASVNNVFNQDYEYYEGYKMPGITYMIGGEIKFK